MIERIPEFVTNHPLMIAALVGTIGMIVFYEVQRLRRAAAPISPARATRLSNSEEALFIDTRKQSEFEQAHVPGARSVPAGEIDSQLKQLEKLREKPLVLYDEGGFDAQRVAKTLARNGFTRLYAIDGGLPAWRKADLPTQQGGEARKSNSGGKKKKSRKNQAKQKSE